MRVALVGEEAAGVQVLRLLVALGHEVVVVLSDGARAGRGATVPDTARHLGLPVRPAEEVRGAELARRLAHDRTDLLLNVHSLHIVAPEVLEAPRLGAYNLHPGPLPEYAGLNVPSWALYRGERGHGVTVHRMAPAVDAGDIAYQSRFPVGPRDTALAVATACVRLGLSLLERLIDAAAGRHPIPAEVQDPKRRRWFDPGPPEEGRLDWDRPAGQILDFVRACDWGPFASPWGHPTCRSEAGTVAVLRAAATGRPATRPAGTVAGVEGDAVLVAAGDEVMRVERVAIDGRRSAPAAALRAGEVLTAT